MSDAVRVLEATRKELSDPYKWHKGGPYNVYTGGRCLVVTTLNIATALQVPRYNSGVHFLDMLAKKRGFSDNHINKRVSAQFNDHPDTTHEKLLEFIDEALVMARAAGG